jgi:hypothetical protein
MKKKNKYIEEIKTIVNKENCTLKDIYPYLRPNRYFYEALCGHGTAYYYFKERYESLRELLKEYENEYISDLSKNIINAITEDELYLYYKKGKIDALRYGYMYSVINILLIDCIRRDYTILYGVNLIVNKDIHFSTQKLNKGYSLFINYFSKNGEIICNYYNEGLSSEICLDEKNLIDNVEFDLNRYYKEFKSSIYNR